MRACVGGVTPACNRVHFSDCKDACKSVCATIHTLPTLMVLPPPSLTFCLSLARSFAARLHTAMPASAGCSLARSVARTLARTPAPLPLAFSPFFPRSPPSVASLARFPARPSARSLLRFPLARFLARLLVPLAPAVPCQAALHCLFQGEMNRSIAEHQMNKNSTRSHCVFTIYVEARSRVESSERLVVSKLNLVDLAGTARRHAGTRLHTHACTHASAYACIRMHARTLPHPTASVRMPRLAILILILFLFL